MHITEFVEFLNKKGYDTSGIDNYAIEPDSYPIYLYNSNDHIFKWKYDSIYLGDNRYNCNKYIQFDGQRNMVDKIDINTISTIYIYQIGNEYIIYTDETIISSPINMMINARTNKWNFKLANTIKELEYVLLYYPDSSNSIEPHITLFYRDNQVVFVSVLLNKENNSDFILKRIYDKYSESNKYTYLFKDTTVEPLPYIAEDGLYGIDSLYNRIDKELPNLLYLVPKYEIFKTVSSGSVINAINRYAFNIYELNIVQEIMKYSTDDSDTECLELSIVEKYASQYLIGDINGYYYYHNHAMSKRKGIRSYLSKYKPFITVRKGTVISHNGNIFPLQEDLKCINMDMLPMSWRMDSFPYRKKDICMKYHYILYNPKTSTIFTYETIMKPKVPQMFKIYIVKDMHTDDDYYIEYMCFPYLYENAIPCTVYEKEINQSTNTEEIPIFLKYINIPNKYKDIYILYN